MTFTQKYREKVKIFEKNRPTKEKTVLYVWHDYDDDGIAFKPLLLHLVIFILFAEMRCLFVSHKTKHKTFHVIIIAVVACQT